MLLPFKCWIHPRSHLKSYSTEVFFILSLILSSYLRDFSFYYLVLLSVRMTAKRLYNLPSDVTGTLNLPIQFQVTDDKFMSDLL